MVKSVNKFSKCLAYRGHGYPATAPGNFDKVAFCTLWSDVEKCDPEVVSFDLAFEFRYNVLLCAESSQVDNSEMLNPLKSQISLDNSRD